MPSLNIGGGDFIPSMKFSATSGLWSARENSNDVHLQNPGRLLFNFATIKVGWVCFPAKAAPITHWDQILGTRSCDRPNPVGEGPKPSQFNTGFEVEIYGLDQLAELQGRPLGHRQWLTNSQASCNFLNEIWGEYEAQSAQYPGQVPIVQIGQAKLVQTNHGTKFDPTGQVVGWQAFPMKEQAQAQAPSAPPMQAPAMLPQQPMQAPAQMPQQPMQAAQPPQQPMQQHPMQQQPAQAPAQQPHQFDPNNPQGSAFSGH